jgi:hypothetical protein
MAEQMITLVSSEGEKL